MLGPTSCGGKCAFGTSATDTDWRMRPLNWLWLAISIRKREVLATEVRDFVRKERDDHFERFIEHVETFGECGAKAYAVGVGLFIIPTSAKTKFEPTIRNHVDSRSHIRHHRRVPIGKTCDKYANTNALGRLRKSCECRPPFKTGAVRVIRMDGIEVIEVPSRFIQFDVVSGLPHIEHRLPRGVLR